jgi:hypothetical protein
MASEAGNEVEIIAIEGQTMNVVNVTKGHSWVYDYAEKIVAAENTMFHCRFELESGEKCEYKVIDG